MNPCRSRRESVALLASGACPDDQAVELRTHLLACPGCREYLRQLTALCDDHTNAARELSAARVPPSLSSRVASRIRAESKSREPDPQEGLFIGWGRIAGMAALLSLLVVAAAWFYQALKTVPPVQVTEVPRPPSPARTAGARVAANSLVAYRLALNRSPEAFEALLSEEAARPVAHPQIALRVGRELRELEL